MKYAFFIIVLVGFVAVQAQSKVYIGFKAGGQLATAYMDHTITTKFITTDFITGYNGGALVKIFTKKRDALINPGLQTGLVFDQKGWGQVFPDTDPEVPKYRVKLSYIQLPMEAIINFGRGKTKTFVTLGWYLEYLVNVSKSDYPTDAQLQQLEDRGIDFYTYRSDRDRKLGYGLRVSAGGQKDFSFGSIHLDVFGTFNIGSVLDHQDFKTGIPDLSNLYTAGFSIGYLIPLGKLDY